jgi:zinc D-Ala-D-Ala carboxypeptidase
MRWFGMKRPFRSGAQKRRAFPHRRAQWLVADLAACAFAGILVVGAFTAPVAPLGSAQAQQPSPPRPSPPQAAYLAAPGCDAPEFNFGAARNRESLRTLQWAPYRRPETGWEIYAPLIANEIGAACDPTSTGFARALARWQDTHGGTPSGIFGSEDFQAFRAAWNSKRNVMRRPGTCPDPPPEANLAAATPAESYGGKLIQLRPRALQAYRAMIKAARAEAPGTEGYLQIFSAYRSPAYDEARCARDGNCDGIRRARSCSPHRTGLVMDLYLGAAPGYGPDSTADPNRRFLVRGAAYQWLVKNAARFSFANYPFEPWHWEWTGEAP